MHLKFFKQPAVNKGKSKYIVSKCFCCLIFLLLCEKTDGVLEKTPYPHPPRSDLYLAEHDWNVTYGPSNKTNPYTLLLKKNVSSEDKYLAGNLFYEEGKCNEATEYLAQAAEEGDRNAMQFLASALRRDPKGCFEYDEECSLKWHVKIAQQFHDRDSADSLFIVATEIYQNSDFLGAKEIYRQLIEEAVALGFDYAKYNLAVILIEEGRCDDSKKKKLYSDQIPASAKKKSYWWDIVKEFAKSLPGAVTMVIAIHNGVQNLGLQLIGDITTCVLSGTTTFIQIRQKKAEDEGKELDRLFEEGEKKIIILLKEAGNAGNGDAWALLAELHATGKCANKDLYKASAYCQNVPPDEKQICGQFSPTIDLEKWQEAYRDAKKSKQKSEIPPKLTPRAPRYPNEEL